MENDDFDFDLDLSDVHEETELPQKYQEGQAPSSSRTDSNTKRVTALTSSLSGYQRFCVKSRTLDHRENAWKKADKQAQITTMRLLLEHIPSMEGTHWAEEICYAATSCPPDILKLMISKGANLSMQVEETSILQWAARTERQSFVVSRMLMEAGADKNMTEEDLSHLLREALKHFQPSSRSHAEGRKDKIFKPQYYKDYCRRLSWVYEDYGKLLGETTSLEEAFGTGPGALVHYLLQRVPGFQLETDAGGVLLQCAAAAGHDELVQILIGHGADVNWTGSYYGTALQAAARFAHIQTTRLLLDAGSNPNIRGGKHDSALIAAVLARSFQLVTLLLQSGTYNCDQGTDLSNALKYALCHKDMKIALALIAAGANGQSLFIEVCATGHLPLIEILLNVGVNVNVYGLESAVVHHETGSPVHAAIHIQRPDIVKMLLVNDFDLEADFGHFEHPLTFATRKGDLASMDILLDSLSKSSFKVLREAIELGIEMSNSSAIQRLIHHDKSIWDSNTDFNFGIELTKKACTKQNGQITEMLLEWLSEGGAVDTICAAILSDLPSTSAEIYEILLEYTPCTRSIFLEACIRDYPTVAKIGLGQGIGYNLEDTKERSAFVLACATGSASVVKLLIDHDADPNSIHPKYGTPLRAAMEGCAASALVAGPSVESLPEDVANHARLLVKIQRHSHRTVDPHLSYQKMRRYESVVQMLLSRGAKVDISAGCFGTTLSLAAFMGLRDTFDSLIQHGASLDESSGFLQSPLAAAILGGHSKMAKEIISLGPGGSSAGLCCACKTGNLSVVKALLDSGVNPHAATADGQTALQLVLRRVADRGRSLLHRPNEDLPATSINVMDILRLLVTSSSTTLISDQDLVFACEIENDEVREQVLDIMIARAASPYFPEAGLIQLLQHGCYIENGAIQKLLQHRKIKEIPIRVILAAENTMFIKELVSYDPRYNITTATFDTVMTESGQIWHIEEVVELLLHEGNTINLSEADVLAALRRDNSYAVFDFDSCLNGTEIQESYRNEEDGPHIIEMMFDRSESLTTTEEMLKAVRTPRDLDVLLDHINPDECLVTLDVMSAWPKYLRKRNEMSRMVHDYHDNLITSPDL